MTFYDVIEDIKKLIGLDLQSIRPGANIRILEVDEDRSCLILQTSAGATRSRPLGELQLIWNEMNRLPAVHVDEVLHGSGTSRNQPETILANLPYVEWLKLDNKKHIAFVGKNTHPYGTLKQMDSIAASNLKQSGKKNSVTKSKVIIVTSDLADTISSLQRVLPGAVTAISQGAYSFESTNLKATVVASASISVSPGTYPILAATPISGTKAIKVQEREYFVIDEGFTKLFIEKK